MSRALRNFIIMSVSLSIIFGLAILSISNMAKIAADQFTSVKKIEVLHHLQTAISKANTPKSILPFQRPGLHIYSMKIAPPDAYAIDKTISKKTEQWIKHHPSVNKFSILYYLFHNKNDAHYLIVEFEPNILTHSSIREDFWMLLNLTLLFFAICIWIAYDFNRPLAQLKLISNAINAGNSINQIIAVETPEIRTIAAAVNEQSNRISQLMNDRTQMLAAISHDLRTPITRLRLRAEDLPSGQLRKKILADCNDMETMINAVLDFVQSESSESATNVDLVSLLETLCHDRADVGMQCEFSSALNHSTLNCQLNALKRALANLIDNGIKYGNAVSVTLRDDDKHLLIDILDSGPGIPENEQQRVFQPFYRLESSRNKHTGGTGLGLVIAKNIIQHHGGNIQISNHPEGGLLVQVVLPKQN